jgi:hypothetical protein
MTTTIYTNNSERLIPGSLVAFMIFKVQRKQHMFDIRVTKLYVSENIKPLTVFMAKTNGFIDKLKGDNYGINGTL